MKYTFSLVILIFAFTACVNQTVIVNPDEPTQPIDSLEIVSSFVITEQNGTTHKVEKDSNQTIILNLNQKINIEVEYTTYFDKAYQIFIANADGVGGMRLEGFCEDNQCKWVWDASYSQLSTGTYNLSLGNHIPYKNILIIE